MGCGLAWVLPLLDWLSLAGEVQYGGNLDSFLMGGGVNPSNGKAIRGVAGWVRATVKPTERMEINLIYGEDDPRNGPLAVGDRSNNRVISANLKQTVYPNFVVGLEFDRFVTDYVGSSSRDANVLWVSGIFDF